MSDLVIKSVDQIKMMMTLFQIQYGDKSLFDVFGDGGSDTKIKNLEYFEETSVYGDFVVVLWIEFLNRYKKRQMWVKVPISDGEILTERIKFNWNKNGQYREEYILSLESFVKLLNFEDKI